MRNLTSTSINKLTLKRFLLLLVSVIEKEENMLLERKQFKKFLVKYSMNLPKSSQLAQSNGTWRLTEPIVDK
jgi:hypothetical protein